MGESPTFESDDEGATIGEPGVYQRSEPRDSMFLGATIRLIDASETWQLRVRNISAGGLMADCSGPLKRGDRVELELRGIGLLGGIIAWTANGRIGIAFEKPIDPTLTRKPVGQSRGPALPTATDMKRPRLRPL